MLWILLVGGALGTFLTLIECIYSIEEWVWDRFWILLKKLIICIAVGIVGFLGLWGIDKFTYDEVVQTNNWELVSIADDSQISGNGSGGLFYLQVYIDTNEVYSYYYKVNDKGIKRGKVYADVTTIYKNDDCIPHIVEYTTYTKNKMNRILRIILGFGWGESSNENYEIYIPTGTIFRTFNLDSQ